MTTLVLDSGALIALERRDRLTARRLRVLWENGLPVIVPAGCLAQVWRDGERQAALAQALKQPQASVKALDGQAARRVGALLARSGTSDVVDAHVALVALDADAVVATSDPGDIRRLAPSVRVIDV